MLSKVQQSRGPFVLRQLFGGLKKRGGVYQPFNYFIFKSGGRVYKGAGFKP